jgi:hypothetical protein
VPVMLRTLTYAAVLICACAVTVNAQNPNNEQISPTVDIGLAGVTVSSPGTLQYFSYGNGYCSGYHRIYATAGGATLKEHTLTHVTTYTGNISGDGQASACYRATVYAAGVFGTSQQITSGQACVASPAPPPCSTCGCNISFCEPSESCPLILDLNGDGIFTTSLDDPVNFWIDLNGQSETTAWTNPATEEGFLWMDLNNDHAAQVTELFGSRMIAPNGQYHAHGFDALQKYDRPYFGGDGDGKITHKDDVWARLKLWVDRNHDGVSQPTEISVPSAHRIVALNLQYADGDIYDENGNEIYLVGSYVIRAHGKNTEPRLMADVEFKYRPN